MGTSAEANGFAGILKERRTCRLLELQNISLQASSLPGWFCHLPVDIRTAGGSPGDSRKQWLFVCLWISREERWHEVIKNKERVIKEQLSHKNTFNKPISHFS